jgi:hypothetical protein
MIRGQRYYLIVPNVSPELCKQFTFEGLHTDEVTGTITATLMRGSEIRHTSLQHFKQHYARIA